MMGLEDKVLGRLTDEEDLFVERKSTPRAEEIRKTVVAFANGLPSSDTGVLFLGIDNNGRPSGKIEDPDKTQRDVRNWLQECFPPIDGFRLCALTVDGQHVVAVEVSASRDRPHFTGRPWVRVGSETTQVLSRELFDRMIDDRNDLCWELRLWEGRPVSVVEEHNPEVGRRGWGPEMGATLVSINRFYLVYAIKGVRRSRSLRRVMLERDTENDRPRLLVAQSALA
jgi:hypothetical protein